MRAPRYFTFTATLERNDGTRETEEDVKCTVRVESYAAACGFPDEPSNGRIDCTITNTEHAGTPLTSDEIEELTSQAYEQARYHR